MIWCFCFVFLLSICFAFNDWFSLFSRLYYMLSFFYSSLFSLLFISIHIVAHVNLAICVWFDIMLIQYCNSLLLVVLFIVFWRIFLTYTSSNVLCIDYFLNQDVCIASALNRVNASRIIGVVGLILYPFLFWKHSFNFLSFLSWVLLLLFLFLFGVVVVVVRVWLSVHDIQRTCLILLIDQEKA